MNKKSSPVQYQNVAHNMKKVTKLKLSLIILVSVLLTNCKSENKTENNISELNLTKDISDFTSKMTEKDTIRIIANLTMEYWARIDELVLTKKNNELILQTTVKEDTTFELKYQMRKNTLSELNIENPLLVRASRSYPLILFPGTVLCYYPPLLNESFHMVLA